MTKVTENTYTGLEVAVIGMACHFPGSDDWRSYWKNLENGFEAVEKIDTSMLPDQEGNVENFVGARIVLQNKDLFDSDFFDYRPAEAVLMNPLHRIFHECVWEALEDAGYDAYQSKDLIGLYAGGNENLNWKLYSIIENSRSEIDNYTLEYLNSRDYLASLVAYKLNFKGPVVSINTACSTTLVTVNMAYKSLLMGETDLALAGGISIVTQEQNGYFYEEGMIASKDGHCRAFDKSASGTVRGEGAGVVVLKRLADATRDGDNIYAIIKGAAINNDGKQKVGFTAPAVEGQVECIKRAQKFAKVPSESISYVETHGTGTRLGDLIEIEALNIAFNHNTNHQCAIGSVKTNLGHLDTAAGIAGFIKTVLSLKNKKIPASLHFTEPNPDISFNQGPFYVNASLADWQSKDGSPRRAGVSSFGIGGTNAHVILEEAPVKVTVREDSEHHLLILSARSEDSLKRYIKKLRDFLTGELEVDLNDLCYTLREGRRQFEFRKAFVLSSGESPLQLLNAKSADENIQHVADSPARVIFMFPGQGSQYLNMGRGIYENNPFFKDVIDEGLEKLKAITGEDFKGVLYSDNPADDRIHNTRYTQPLLFLFEYALSRLLISSGISPDYLIGHSIGEYTAAAISGVFSFSDALKIVNRRAEILEALAGGLMLSANLSEEVAISYLNEEVSLAAVNAPNQVVFSGRTSAVEALAKILVQHQIGHTYLKTSHAFHSYMLDSVIDKFRVIFDEITLNAPVIPFVSNLTGRMVDPKDAVSPDYWSQHMRSTVKFSEGLTSLSEISGRVKIIEVGPGKVLSNLINDHTIFNQSDVPVNLVRNIYNSETDLKYFIGQIGKLWETGYKPDWSKILCLVRGKRISLPTYSFDWKRYPTEVNSLEEEMVKNGGIPDKQQQAQNLPAKWMYYASWRRSVFKKYSPKIQSFLFFSTGDEFAEKLITELESRGHTVVDVVTGGNYSRVNGRKYYIRPDVEADYEQLITDILKEEIYFTDIIYSWTIQAGDGWAQTTGDDMQLNLLYFGIVYCARCLAKNDIFKDVNFIVFTRSLHRVLGVEEIQYQQSLALGLLPSIQAEYGVSCFNVDFLEEEKDDLVTFLVKELEGLDDAENCIALRHGRKWARMFQPLSAGRTDAVPVIKQGGLYIITGGLGNAGFALAKYLLTKYQVSLVLTGRKELSVIKENDLELEKNGRLRELNQLSDDVFYYNIDISDLNAVGKMAEEIEQKHGTVNGIIHAAGITDGRYFDFIDAMTRENAMILFSPKVGGIENIYKVYSDRELDFVWVTSSISTVLGGLGYAAYAAANSYADYFIAAKSAQLTNWVSIGLSELAFTENEISNMPQALNPDELCAVFDSSLNLGVDSMLYQSKRDLQIRSNKNNKVASLNSPSRLSKSNINKQTFKPRSIGVEYTGPITETEKKLANIFENFFAIDKIGVEDNFFELGGDSLKGMILLKRVNAEFKVNLQMADFLKNPDIRTLSLKIDQMTWFGSENSMKYEVVI